MAEKRGCQKVGQHLPGTHFPVLIHRDTKDSGCAEVGSRIRHELSTEGQSSRGGSCLQDPQCISRKVQKNGLHILTYLHEEWETESQGREIYLKEGTPTEPGWHHQDLGHSIGWISAGPRTGARLSSPISFLFIGANLFPCQVCSLLIKLCECFSFGLFWLLPCFFDPRHWGILCAPFHEGVTYDTYIKLLKALRYGSHIPNKNVLRFIQNLSLRI